MRSDTWLYDVLGADYSLVGDATAPSWGALLDAAVRLRLPLTPIPLPAATAVGTAPGLVDKVNQTLGRPVRLFSDGVVLVRPDQHVAWRGTEIPDPDALLRMLTGHAKVVIEQSL